MGNSMSPMTSNRAGLQAQLTAAHEVIENLRHENDHLRGAARHVLMNHNNCVCRHTRRALSEALSKEGE